MRSASVITGELIASGLSQPQTTLLMELVLFMSSGISASNPVESPEYRALEKRRAWDRERKRTAKLRSANSTGIPPDQGGIPPDIAETPCLLKGDKEALQRDVLEKKESKRGKRLDARESLSAENRAFAETLIPPENVESEWAEFVDYWIGVPGSRGCKLNWPATWRNRVRDISKKYRGRTISAKPLTEFQRKQQATNDVTQKLRDAAVAARGGGETDRFLSHDHGERPGDLRGGPSAHVLALSRASGSGGG